MGRRWIRGLLVAMLAVVLAGGGVTPAAAQGVGDYPNRPITMLIPFAAGGASDIQVRALAAVAEQYLGVPLRPQLMPGAVGAIAAEYLSKAAPDGYTLLHGAPHHTTVIVHIEDVPYDPLQFVPVVQLTAQESIIATPVDRPWNTYWEFVEAVRSAPPYTYAFASSGAFGGPHIRDEVVFARLGLKMRHIPYDGGAQLTMAVVRGEVDYGAGLPAHMLPQIREGKAKPLAIRGSKRNPALPDVPTLEELGVHDPYNDFRTVFAPPGTPREIVEWLEARFMEIMQDPSYVALMERLGTTIDPMPGQEFYEKVYVPQYHDFGEAIKSLGLSK